VREAFGIRMLAWSDIGFVVLIGIGVMAAIEAYKLLLRRRQPAMAPALAAPASRT
jgi:hypothetical protein